MLAKGKSTLLAELVNLLSHCAVSLHSGESERLAPKAEEPPSIDGGVDHAVGSQVEFLEGHNVLFFLNVILECDVQLGNEFVVVRVAPVRESETFSLKAPTLVQDVGAGLERDQSPKLLADSCKMQVVVRVLGRRERVRTELKAVAVGQDFLVARHWSHF